MAAVLKEFGQGLSRLDQLSSVKPVGASRGNSVVQEDQERFHLQGEDGDVMASLLQEIEDALAGATGPSGVLTTGSLDGPNWVLTTGGGGPSWDILDVLDTIVPLLLPEKLTVSQ